MFYESDDSEQQTYEQQFTYYSPIKQQINTHKKRQFWEDIVQSCHNLKYKILGQKFQKKAQEIVLAMTQNITFHKNHKKSLSQSTSFLKKSSIASIKINRNQVHLLSLFTQKIISLFSKHSIRIQIVSESQVRDIILMMYQKLTDISSILQDSIQNQHSDHEQMAEIEQTQNLEKQEKKISPYEKTQNQKQNHSIIVFIVDKMTDLSWANFNQFEKALEQLKYCLIIPTYVDLQNYAFDRISQQSSIEVTYYNLFQSKDLFIEYMFKCITNKDIKAYLPKQSIGLISDFDYYPLSFEQGVRRLIFCIQKSYLINKKERVFVEFEFVVDSIKKAINESCILTQEYNDKQSQKIIKCVLDQKARYTISDPLISKIRRFYSHLSLTQDSVIDQIRKSMIKLFNKHQKLKDYATILQNESVTLNDFKKKNQTSRSAMLGIDPSTYKSKKYILEDQLSLIIHKVTQNIRVQAAFVKWDQINFENRMKPQIPRLISEGIQKMSQKYQRLKNLVGEYYSINLQEIIKELKNENLQAGQLMYILKDFEISGLIQRNGKSSKISYLNNFFEKAKFAQ